jgi:putative transposase
VNETWLSKKQVIAITGWSATWLKLQVRTGKLTARDSNERARNGRMHKEYCAASLPEEVRTKLAGEVAASKPAQGTAITLAPLFAGHNLASTSRVILVDPKDQAKAAKRFAIISPLLSYIAAAPESNERKRYLQCATRDGQTVTTADRLAAYLGELHGVGARSIWRWASSYKKNGGEVALADKRRADKGQSRWAKDYPELAILAAHKLLTEEARSKDIWKYLSRKADEMGIKAPCYDSIRTFCNHGISESMKTMALKGKREYNETFSPWMKRLYSDVASNELWVMDHQISDVLKQNDIYPPFDLRHMRVHITTVLDFRSRSPLSTVFSENGSSQSILAALLKAIYLYGPPKGVYFDNGHDFDLMAEAMRRIGVEVTNCLPYHPQSKHIERYHNNFHQHLDRLFLNAYTGIAPHKRPDRTHAALARHQGLIVMKKKGVLDAAQVAAASDLPLASDYIRDALAWIELDYKVTPQRGEGMDGLSPAAIFDKYRWKDERAPLTPEKMALLMPMRKNLTVDASAITLLKRRYMWARGDEMAKLIMHERTTQKVCVLYNPADLDRVIVLDLDGHYLCSLVAEIMMRQSNDQETRDRVKDFSRERNGLERDVRDSIAHVSREALRIGYQTPLEDLRERGKLLATGTDSIVQRAQRIDLRPSADSHAPESSAQIAKDIYRRLNGN